MTQTAESEADLQGAVTDLAVALGWRWAHHRPARTANGWRTPVEGSHAKGLPDLLLVRERVVFAELKGPSGKPTREQADWLEALHAAGVEAYLWTPSSWPHIERTLRRQEGHGG